MEEMTPATGDVCRRSSSGPFSVDQVTEGNRVTGWKRTREW